ncbi:Protein LDB19 [Nakaseomyces bracarensis]|uniref:Protein LDB19 n=1 Tax=Nakaseomyces bracarensis TaxID=273131 RepID=A0ABR4NZ94_9SACH
MLGFQKLTGVRSIESDEAPRTFGSPVKLRRGSNSTNKVKAKLEDISGKPSSKLPIDLELNVQSPPCVLYGSATDSTGSLICGQFVLKIKDPFKDRFVYSVNDSSDVRSPPQQQQQLQQQQQQQQNNGYDNISITTVQLRFVQKVTYSKPFIPDASVSASSTALQLPAAAANNIINCKNCHVKYTSLKTWDIQKNKKNIKIGRHEFPFSYLIPGSVPSTSALGLNANSKIQYELIGTVTYIDPINAVKHFQVKINMPVPVTRSIHRGPDKNSLRVFPPTQLTAAAVLPNVVYPKSTFPLEMKLEGISSPSTGKGSDKRWRMRKLAWRVEETTRVKTNVCSQHKEDLHKLEKQVKFKEEERSKKPPLPIKRYGDIGPQIRIALSSPSNMSLSAHRNARNAPQPLSTVADGTPNSATLSSGEDQAGNIDTEETESADQFVHPSDDAMRQELLQQQQRQRELQLKQELKNSSSLFSEEIRIISKGEMKNGWKTDFDAGNGKIELVTDIDLLNSNSGVSNPIMHTSTTYPYKEKPNQPPITIACDIQDPNLGIYVSHTLAVEIVVAEEALQYSNGQPLNSSSRRSSLADTSGGNAESQSSTQVDEEGNDMDQRILELSPMFANRSSQRAKPVEYNDLAPQTSKSSIGSGNGTGRIGSVSATPRIVSVPTGAARVLRMQFRINVTERSGLGISWDEEVPPMYHDIKLLSPPSYDDAINGLQEPKNIIYEEQESGRSSPVTPIIAIPPLAHHNDHRNSLTAVQSPQLENIISIQGAVPFTRGYTLTPHNTTDVRLRGLSEALDTDRITQ